MKSGNTRAAKPKRVHLRGPQGNPGDQALPGTPGTGENACPTCRGSGRIGAIACETCGGTGKVIEGLAGG